MIFVQESSVEVAPNRQRREFSQKAISDLAASIQDKGLLHPPVVRITEEGVYELVAGERRLRAMRTILECGGVIECDGKTGLDNCVPVTLIKDLTPLELMEAELEENTLREDLSWQELAAATAQLHALRSAQAAGRGEVQTFRDTAAEIRGASDEDTLGAAPTQVAYSVILARHLDDPEVRKAKTQKEAIKIVEKKARREHVAKLAAEFEVSRPENPHTLLEGSMLELSQSLPDSHFQVILTDPPYGINADKFGEQSDQGHNYEDSKEYFATIAKHFAAESFRVAAERAHAYVFCDPRHFGHLEALMVEAGWEVWPIPLIWAKSTGMLPRPEHAPRRTYEAILYAIKGGKKVVQVKGDVISVPSVRNLDHGAQKPVDLYCDLLSRSANPGDNIIDFFAGSGTIFPAANRMQLRATGIEISPDNANLCRTRMLDDERGSDSLDSLNL